MHNESEKLRNWTLFMCVNEFNCICTIYFFFVIKKFFCSPVRSALSLRSANLGMQHTIVLSRCCFRFHLQFMKFLSFICQTVKRVPPANVIFHEKIHLVKFCHVGLCYYVQDFKLIELKTSVNSCSLV